jgi:hypothetical protein
VVASGLEKNDVLRAWVMAGRWQVLLTKEGNFAISDRTAAGSAAKALINAERQKMRAGDLIAFNAVCLVKSQFRIMLS